MKIHREEILRISGNGGEVKFKGETIAEIKNGIFLSTENL